MERPPSLVTCSSIPAIAAPGPGESQVTFVSAAAAAKTLFASFGDGTLALVDADSAARLFRFRPHASTLTHVRIRGTKLISVGDDASGVPVLKLWDLEKKDQATNDPRLIRAITVQVNNKVFPVTTLAATTHLSQIAIGLENGVVLLVKGDIANSDKSVKVKVLYESESSISGLAFSSDDSILYVSTLNSLVAFQTGLSTSASTDPTLKEGSMRKLDPEFGCQVGCFLVTPPLHSLSLSQAVLARNDGIYFYDWKGRGTVFTIEGEKTLMCWFRHYLVIVSRPPPRRAGPTLLSSTQAHESDGEDDDHQKLGTILTVYDLRCKLIAFQGSFEGQSSGSKNGGGILSIVSEWDELFVLTVDQKMYRLEEKDMSTKLELLYSKNMYTLALSLVASPSNSVLPSPATHRTASTPTASSSSAALLPQDPDLHHLTLEIHKRYADHLYSNQEYQSAMTHYLHTLSHLEPSYVIRKYLDAQRIHLLVVYLEQVHNHAGLATPDHTTLLVNCYTKLGATQDLDAFLHREDVHFDAETAIRTCRAAGFSAQALYLAQRFHETEWYLHILVDDLGRYEEAVSVVMGLSPREMEKGLRRYGGVLVRERVEEMVAVLVLLCTTERGGAGGGMEESSLLSPGGEEDLSLSAVEGGGLVLMGKRGGDGIAADGEGKRVIGAEEFVHLFVDMDEWCVVFLERVIEIRWGILLDGSAVVGEASNVMDEKEESSLVVVCNTLLEMYLSLAGKEGVEQGQERKVRALRLLQHPKTRYDLDHALILCQIHKYQPGVMFLYDKMGMYKEILEHYTSHNLSTLVIESCLKYGNEEPSLWKLALSYFATRTTEASSNEPDLPLLLSEIDKRNILSPLEIVQILSQHPTVTIATIRPYLLSKLAAEKKQTTENARLTASYQQETERMKTLLTEVQTKPVVFQGSKCSLCAEVLDLPSVYFMCRHGYHARCVGVEGSDEVEKECPICAPEHRVVESLAKTQLENAGRHDLFLGRLEGKKGDARFAVVAEYFGKDLFAGKGVDR